MSTLEEELRTGTMIRTWNVVLQAMETFMRPGAAKVCREGASRCCSWTNESDLDQGAQSGSKREGELLRPEIFIKVNKASEYNRAREMHMERVQKRKSKGRIKRSVQAVRHS